MLHAIQEAALFGASDSDEIILDFGPIVMSVAKEPGGWRCDIPCYGETFGFHRFDEALDFAAAVAARA